jgi:hypothetical protein
MARQLFIDDHHPGDSDPNLISEAIPAGRAQSVIDSPPPDTVVTVIAGSEAGSLDPSGLYDVLVGQPAPGR